MMFEAAALFGPPLPRPRPVGACAGGRSFVFTKDCDASFHLISVVAKLGREKGPLSEEFPIRIDDFERLFICPEVELQRNRSFGR